MSNKAKPTKDFLIKIIVKAGQATPSPPVGPALGQKGIKAIDFCKQFNDKTKEFIPGTPLRCQITARPDRTFTFQVKPPTTTHLLLTALNLSKGPAKPKVDPMPDLSLKAIYEIAVIKKQFDESFKDMELKKICQIVSGNAKSMGINLVE
jgi:large subunit ribosomal protein L11